VIFMIPRLSIHDPFTENEGASFMTRHKDDTAADAVDESPRLPYEAPRILSVAPLEAVAAVCSPPTGPFGKTLPPCSTLGS